MASNKSYPKRATRVAAILFALIALVLIAGMVAAGDSRGPATKAPAPLAPFAPTTAELLAMPPSIERYAAAHTLPLAVRQAAGLNETTYQFLPLATFGLAQPSPVVLSAGQPNGLNAWTISWTADANATGYEVHEAQSADFADAQPILVGPQTSVVRQKTASPSNVYYYRVRSLVGQQAGPWSNVGVVVGAYYDDFSNPASGWSLRRTTYIEEVHSYYDRGEYVLDVNDRWDWGIASPGKPAPRLPYVIDFYATIVDGANLWSFGGVFGGDWPSPNCPMAFDFDGWYLHQDCFNHFYNANSIFYGPIKLLFERIDYLEWCIPCGGSPMKRLGDVNPGSIKTYKNIDPTGWNHYRIEVRDDVIKIYAAKRGLTPELQYQYFDTRYVTSPYFGLFASTDEYTNALWRFDDFRVTPID